MKVEAKNAAHAARYEVYLDGVNVSGVVTEADDIAHQVTFVVRDHTGAILRRDDRKALTVIGHGHVVIVSKVNAPALVS